MRKVIIDYKLPTKNYINKHYNMQTEYNFIHRVIKDYIKVKQDVNIL